MGFSVAKPTFTLTASQERFLRVAGEVRKVAVRGPLFRRGSAPRLLRLGLLQYNNDQSLVHITPEGLAHLASLGLAEVEV